MATRTDTESMPTTPVNFEITRDGAIAILTFVREDRLNALDHQMMRDLAETFAELDRDPSVSVIVMTGRGKAFVAGADINGYLDIELLDYVDFQRLGRKCTNRSNRIRNQSSLPSMAGRWEADSSLCWSPIS